MKRLVALVFSYVFQPLLLATFLTITILWIVPTDVGLKFSLENKYRLLLIVFLITAVLPVISIFLMKLTNGISSVHMHSREERVVPFFLVAIYYIVAAYLLTSKISLGPLFDVVIITSAVLVLLSALITIFWKISIHAMGIAGFLGFLVGMNYYSPDGAFYLPIMLLFIVAGLVMSSRLVLNAHKPAQVWIGACVGFLCCFGSMIMFN